MTIPAQIARVQAELLQTLLAALDAAAASSAAVGAVARSGTGQGNMVHRQGLAEQTVQATLIGLADHGQASSDAVASRRDGQTDGARAPDGPRVAEALINGRTVRLILDPDGLADGFAQHKLAPGTRLALAFAPQAGDGLPRARIVDLRPAGAAAAISREPNAATGAPIPGRALAAPAAIAALARQDSAATLLASLQAVSRQPAVMHALPLPVQRSIAAVLALVASPDVLAEPDGKGLRQAIATSGLFHEAQAREAAPTVAEARPIDLKGALSALKASLTAALPSGPASAGANAATGEKVGSAVSRPAPPVPDGALQPRGDVVARLGETAAVVPLMAQLLGETQAAIDRLTLHQFASLPDMTGEGAQNPSHASGGQSAAVATPIRLLLELPFLLDGKAGTLPLTIEEEPPRRGDGEGEVVRSGWRVRLAFDLEPLGVVQALIGLQAGVLRVAVFAEREATARLARRHAGELESALANGPFPAAVVDVALGSPPALPAKAGHFLDRRT